MRIGVPRETKNSEFRVAITPVGVHELTQRGHRVLVERDAGLGSSFSDDDYRAVGGAAQDTQLLITLDDVLTQEELATARELLARSTWSNGQITAGLQAAKAKNNEQLAENAEHLPALRRGEDERRVAARERDVEVPLHELPRLEHA